MLDGCVSRLIRSHSYVDAVGNLQTCLLAEVLDTVNQLTSHTLLLQFWGQLYLKRYGQIALVRYEPSWNILRDNLHVGYLYHGFLAVDIQCDVACLLKSCNLVLIER